MSDNEELVIDRDKLESFLPLLGAEVAEEEYIRDFNALINSCLSLSIIKIVY